MICEQNFDCLTVGCVPNWRVPVVGGPKNVENGQFVRQLTGFLIEFCVAAGTFSTC